MCFLYPASFARATDAGENITQRRRNEIHAPTTTGGNRGPDDEHWALGRCRKVFFSGFKTKNCYNDLGYLVEIINAATNQSYWHLEKLDAQNHIIEESHGNLTTTNTYDPNTGLLIDTVTMHNQLLNQHLHYIYDVLGNVKERQDLINHITEHFSYDELNRLTLAQTVDKETINYEYNAIGNITYKSDLGHYHYGENHAGPHAVTSISGAKGFAFDYDANGNQTSANNLSIIPSAWER